jgi:molybdopterin molybdotransferase
MIKASDALHIVLKNARVLATESVPLLDSLGRPLAEDIVARENLPPFDNSSMDGFAVIASDCRQASETKPSILRIIGEASAGNVFTRKVSAGQTVRVMTGGVIPRGADAVVPIEHVVEVKGGEVRFTHPVTPRQYIRAAGEDIRRGGQILKKGDRLTPASLGVLAALGHRQVRVFRKPRVNIIATGDELVDVERKAGPGQIRNSTSYALAGYVKSAGGVPRILRIARDNAKSLQTNLKQGLASDVLLITGGVSVGKYDLVKDILAGLGVQIKFWQVNIKPGKPLVFGTYMKTLVFGLPGNPVSTAVTFLEFARPALLKVGGSNDLLPTRVPAILDQPFSKSDGKRHFLRGVAAQREGEFHVVTTGIQSSGAMSSMSKANCLIIIPERATGVRKGDKVEIEFLS